MIQAPTRSALRGIWLCLAVLVPTVVPAQSRSTPQRQAKLKVLLKQHADLTAKFADKIAGLAKERDAENDSAAAQEIRRFVTPVDHEELRTRIFPTELQAPIPKDLPTDERSWRVRLNTLRSDHAKSLFYLAKKCAAEDHGSLAFDLVRETLEFDPDHIAARRVLGYQKNDRQWLTNYAAEMQRKRYRWSDKFGWLPNEFLARYEKGERYYDGRWISAEQETERRRDFRNAWKVRTEHFLVETNHTLEDGVKLARELEDYYRVFFGIFGGFFIPQEQMRQLEDHGSSGSTRVFRVHFYHTRDEYNHELKGKIPQNIELTTGLYLTDPRTSYTFHDPTGEVDVRTTLIHEATHQMFTESRLSRTPIALKANFWIVEGIACYMESYQREGDRITVGNPHYVRFEAARFRRLKNDYYVPLEQFASMGMKEFQASEKLRMNYSQAAGLTHFFMHFADGLYRDALCEHISEIYSQNDRVRQNPQSLQDLTGIDYPELDKQYAAYLRAQEKELSQLGIAPAPESRITPTSAP